MNNADIHQGFDKAEVRDVIANGLINTYEKEGMEYSYTPGTRLEHAQERLRIAQINLQAIKEQEAYLTIMETLGWSEHDVSEETFLQRGKKFFISFIGTEEEYNRLLKQLENEKQ